MLVYKKKNSKKPMVCKIKSPKQLERHLKGVANHRRIEILFLVEGSRGIALEDIADQLNCNLKTISGHTQRLVQAGLIRKNYKGRNVVHEISPYGKILHKFIKTFRNTKT